MFINLFKPKKSQISIKKPDISEFTGELYAKQPRVKLLSNGLISSFLCDSGASFIRNKKYDLTAYPYDLLCNAKGVFCYVAYNDKSFCTTYAPDYGQTAEYETAFSKSGVSYFARTDELKVTTQVRLYSTFECEQREYLFENRSSGELDLSVDVVVEPSFENIAMKKEGTATLVEWDNESNAVTIGNEQGKGYLAIGFLENKPFLVMTKKEECLVEVDSGKTRDIILNEKQIAINFSLKLEKEQKIPLHLLLAFGKTKSASIALLHQIRKQPALDCNNSAKTKFFDNVISKRITKTLLPQLLFAKRDSSTHLDYAFSNTLTLEDLISIRGISSKFPVVVVDIFSRQDKERILAYIQSYIDLKKCFLEFTLVFVYNGEGEIEQAIRAVAIAELKEDRACLNNGIYVISSKGLSSSKENLLHSVSCHIASRSLVRIEVPSPPFVPTFSKKSLLEMSNNVNGVLCIIKGGEDGNKFGAIANVGEELSVKDLVLTSRAELMGEGTIKVDVKLKNEGKTEEDVNIAYYYELLHDKMKRHGNMIKGELIKEENILVLFNPVTEFCFDFGEFVKSKGRWVAISAKGEKEIGFCCDRGAFLSGDLTTVALPPIYDPCLGVYSKRCVESGLSREFELIIATGSSKEEVVSLICKAKALQ